MHAHILDKMAAIVARLPLWAIWGLTLAVIALVGLTDYLTGAELSFSALCMR